MRQIVKILLNKNNPSLEDKIQLLEELYWANWRELDEHYPNEIKNFFDYLESNDLKIQEISKVLSLYNNVEGAYTEKFSQIIANHYIHDSVKFFKALNLNKDEAINLVYIFRNLKIFEDGDNEYSEIASTNQLTDEELNTMNTFFSMYKSICNT